MSVSGNGRGCTTQESRFDVLEVERDMDGKLTQFAADFVYF
ncbi:MAG: hypothetical protein AAGH19_03955 [Pseudomonadota bacterium]